MFELQTYTKGSNIDTLLEQFNNKYCGEMVKALTVSHYFKSVNGIGIMKTLYVVITTGVRC